MEAWRIRGKSVLIIGDHKLGIEFIKEARRASISIATGETCGAPRIIIEA